PGMVLQAARDSSGAAAGLSRVGFTVTKKVGSAVIRNRVKRRLRAGAQGIIPTHAAGGWDFVLIGRQNTIDRDFKDLQSDLLTALAKVGAVQAERRSVRQ
ncbi:MAG: ribonuclease P protein component, partial [Sneathiella sp.]|nr:ribonuclease P protein component [Sneathiella sp.]